MADSEQRMLRPQCVEKKRKTIEVDPKFEFDAPKYYFDFSSQDSSSVDQDESWFRVVHPEHEASNGSPTSKIVSQFNKVQLAQSPMKSPGKSNQPAQPITPSKAEPTQSLRNPLPKRLKPNPIAAPTITKPSTTHKKDTTKSTIRSTRPIKQHASTSNTNTVRRDSISTSKENSLNHSQSQSQNHTPAQTPVKSTPTQKVFISPASFKASSHGSNKSNTTPFASPTPTPTSGKMFMSPTNKPVTPRGSQAQTSSSLFLASPAKSTAKAGQSTLGFHSVPQSPRTPTKSPKASTFLQSPSATKAQSKSASVMSSPASTTAKSSITTHHGDNSIQRGRSNTIAHPSRNPVAKSPSNASRFRWGAAFSQSEGSLLNLNSTLSSSLSSSSSSSSSTAAAAAAAAASSSCFSSSFSSQSSVLGAGARTSRSITFSADASLTPAATSLTSSASSSSSLSYASFSSSASSSSFTSMTFASPTASTLGSSANSAETTPSFASPTRSRSASISHFGQNSVPKQSPNKAPTSPASSSRKPTGPFNLGAIGRSKSYTMSSSTGDAFSTFQKTATFAKPLSGSGTLGTFAESGEGSTLASLIQDHNSRFGSKLGWSSAIRDSQESQDGWTLRPEDA